MKRCSLAHGAASTRCWFWQSCEADPPLVPASPSPSQRLSTVWALQPSTPSQLPTFPPMYYKWPNAEEAQKWEWQGAVGASSLKEDPVLQTQGWGLEHGPTSAVFIINPEGGCGQGKAVGVDRKAEKRLKLKKGIFLAIFCKLIAWVCRSGGLAYFRRGKENWHFNYRNLHVDSYSVWKLFTIRDKLVYSFPTEAV